MTKQVSNQIYAAILPHIGKLNVLLDSSEDILALYHLFTAMDPSTISVQVKYLRTTPSIVTMTVPVCPFLSVTHEFTNIHIHIGIVYCFAEAAFLHLPWAPDSVAGSGVHCA